MLPSQTLPVSPGVTALQYCGLRFPLVPTGLADGLRNIPRHKSILLPVLQHGSMQVRDSHQLVALGRLELPASWL